MVKLSAFMIAAVLSSLFVVVFTTFVADSYSAYSPANYDNSTLESFNKLDDLLNTTESVQDQLEDIEGESGVFDIIGGFFSSGYQSIRLAVGSFDAVNTMTEDAFSNSGVLGEGTAPIKTALITILIISLFIGVILSAILKKDV